MPVEKFWDARIPGKCINTAALYYANAAINIAQDISLVVLPFFMLRSLIMPRKEKISLMIILGLGGMYVYLKRLQTLSDLFQCCYSFRLPPTRALHPHSHNRHHVGQPRHRYLVRYRA